MPEVSRGPLRDLTETGNRARQTSGTQACGEESNCDEPKSACGEG